MNESLKNILRKVPGLVIAKNRVQDCISEISHKREVRKNRAYIKINQEIEMFSVGGMSEKEANLTILSVNQTFPFLAKLIEKLGEKEPLNLSSLEEFCPESIESEETENLGKSFTEYGSDKATRHNYHIIYRHLLQDKSKIDRILEIGIGSNNYQDIVHSMGREGKPGASLFAFRDFLPNAQVFGADIDKRVLFEDDRIKTFYVDQTNLDTFDELGRNVGDEFDLIIDDGLHVPNTNIAVLLFSIDRLKKGGWLVIEDIGANRLPLWQVVSHLLPGNFKPHIIQTKACLVFAIQKLS